MTLPIISIVGKSNTGKTTLIEKLVKELVCRGYSVATIKHDVHGFEIDHEGKDSYRHKEAGAALSIISSPQKIAVIKDVGKDTEIDDIVFNYIDNVDIILTEGYKKHNKPKIEVFRTETCQELLCSEEDNLIAVASESKHDVKAPQFDINDAVEIVEFLEKNFLKKERREHVMLEVDGNIIPHKPFIRDMLVKAIRGMISALKKCENAMDIVIKVKRF